MDEDLRALERAALASPDDATAQKRLARAIVRAGDEARAATILARCVALDPGDADALLELDQATRGGVDPRSPWPSPEGDGRASRRSIARGPSRGAIVERRALAGFQPARGFAVDGEGRAIAADRFETVARLVSIDPGGAISVVSTRIPRSAHDVRILPDALVLAVAEPEDWHGFHVVPREQGESVDMAFSRAARACAVGLGHAVAGRGKQGIAATPLSSPDFARWTAVVPKTIAAFALAPGAIVVALTEGKLGVRGSLHRYELATGKARPPTLLEGVGIDGVRRGTIVVARDGTLFLGLGGFVVALDRDSGEERWRKKAVLDPVALAGESEDVLVLVEPRSFAPLAVSAATGEKLWESRDACLNGLPKIDARGTIYWRREQELVAFDARTGETLASALIGPHLWEFAFAGSGRAYALRHATVGSPAELVVIE